MNFPERVKVQPHPLAGEIVCEETADRFGYRKRIGKISNQGVAIYSAHFKNWLYELQEGRCGYCGDTLGRGRAAQIDHIIPRSVGGSNLPPNLIYACMSCNAGKCHRSIEEVRTMLRLRQSKLSGIIIPKQVVAIEALGIDLGLPKTVVFLCESEGWSHVSIPCEVMQ
jgi:hypothetical protein